MIRKAPARVHFKRWHGHRAFCGVRSHMRLGDRIDNKRGQQKLGPRVTTDRALVTCVQCLKAAPVWAHRKGDQA